MKKVWSYRTAWGVILYLLFFSGLQASASEPEGWIPSIEVLTHGVARTIDISQEPNDFQQLIILVIGHGSVSMMLSKNDVDDDFFFLTGLAISSAGILPVFRFGVSRGQFYEHVDIGKETSPHGLLWLVSWVHSPADDPASDKDDPPYKYTLRLQLQEDNVEW